MQRIFQDLVAGHGFTGSYHSVRRFGPDQELQVDFGQGGVDHRGREALTHASVPRKRHAVLSITHKFGGQ